MEKKEGGSEAGSYITLMWIRNVGWLERFLFGANLSI